MSARPSFPEPGASVGPTSDRPADTSRAANPITPTADGTAHPGSARPGADVVGSGAVPSSWVVPPERPDVAALGDLRRRISRRALALAVGGPLVVVVTYVQAFAAPSEPPSPRAAAEEYFEAITDERWDAAWDLLCSADRQDEQARRRFVDHWTEAARFLPPFGEDPVTAARVRSDERSSVPAYFVEMVMPEDYGSLPLGEVHVVWEDDAFRVCVDA